MAGIEENLRKFARFVIAVGKKTLPRLYRVRIASKIETVLDQEYASPGSFARLPFWISRVVTILYSAN